MSHLSYSTQGHSLDMLRNANHIILITAPCVVMALTRKPLSGSLNYLYTCVIKMAIRHAILCLYVGECSRSVYTCMHTVSCMCASFSMIFLCRSSQIYDKKENYVDDFCVRCRKHARKHRTWPLFALAIFIYRGIAKADACRIAFRHSSIENTFIRKRSTRSRCTS